MFQRQTPQVQNNSLVLLSGLLSVRSGSFANVETEQLVGGKPPKDE